MSMNPTTQVAATRGQVSIDQVTSRDGTMIAYRQIGQGPGVIVLHGAMETSLSHMQFAEALSESFTVYLPDRRGRGLSGPLGDGYAIQKEVDDLDALLTKTDTHRVMGVSSGGLITLTAALSLPAIHQIAAFEPMVVVDNSLPTDFVERYDQEIAEGKTIPALITAMRGSHMGPPFMNAMPRWLIEQMTKMMVAQEDKKAKEGDVTMRMLAPTLHSDFQVVTEMANKQGLFKGVQAEVLLLGGSKSPIFLKKALDALEKILPHLKGRVEFPGLNHGATGNHDRFGQPERVAQEIRPFFGA